MASHGPHGGVADSLDEAKAAFRAAFKRPLSEEGSADGPRSCVGSLFDASELDHFSPLLRFVGEEYPELSSRTRKHRCAKVRKPRRHHRAGQCDIDFLVERFEDSQGGVFLGATMPHHEVTS